MGEKKNKDQSLQEFTVANRNTDPVKSAWPRTTSSLWPTLNIDREISGRSRWEPMKRFSTAKAHVESNWQEKGRRTGPFHAGS